MCHGRLRCVTNTCRTSDIAAAASDLTAAGLRLGGTGATTIAVGTDAGITAFISGATGSTAVSTIPSAAGAPLLPSCIALQLGCNEHEPLTSVWEQLSRLKSRQADRHAQLHVIHYGRPHGTAGAWFTSSDQQPEDADMLGTFGMLQQQDLICRQGDPAAAAGAHGAGGRCHAGGHAAGGQCAETDAAALAVLPPPSAGMRRTAVG